MEWTISFDSFYAYASWFEMQSEHKRFAFPLLCFTIFMSRSLFGSFLRKYRDILNYFIHKRLYKTEQGVLVATILTMQIDYLHLELNKYLLLTSMIQ